MYAFVRTDRTGYHQRHHHYHQHHHRNNNQADQAEKNIVKSDGLIVV